MKLLGGRLWLHCDQGAAQARRLVMTLLPGAVCLDDPAHNVLDSVCWPGSCGTQPMLQRSIASIVGAHAPVISAGPLAASRAAYSPTAC
jgi:hypothetical protein